MSSRARAAPRFAHRSPGGLQEAATGAEGQRSDSGDGAQFAVTSLKSTPKEETSMDMATDICYFFLRRQRKRKR